MLMLDENLARVETSLDIETLRLTVRQGNREVATARLDDSADREKIEAFFWQLLPNLRSAPALVRSVGGHFMDKPDSVISLINLATVRALEQQWGVEIDPLRFRANIYIEGAKPWEEFDWIGSEIRIGARSFQSTARTAAAEPPTSIPPPDAATWTFLRRCVLLLATKIWAFI
jgi:GntR family transcriptional regulator/MocR family aminotransferase